MPMMARMMTSLFWFSPMAMTSERSIFRSSIGTRDSCDRLEKPTPKSSMAMRMPASRSVLRRSSTSTVADIAIDSVISTDSNVAGTCACRSVASSWGTNWGLANCEGETFTATGRRMPASSQRRHCATASAITCWPSAPIRPACSATSMKAAGASRPRCGCCQRTSASTPVSARVRASTLGW
ncbi:MAG: hypothetical protein RJB37_4148 [Pseudomonadota bacterium]